MMILISLVFAFTTSVTAQEGYPPSLVSFSHEKLKRAFIKNNSCFLLTVSVNAQDFLLKPEEEAPLKADSWTAWHWYSGSIGPMTEKSVRLPLKDKHSYDFGPGQGETHIGDYKYSYDFSVPEGTAVYAIEDGIVTRIVQHYHAAHRDKRRLSEVNKVEILHADGSTAEYAHLKANSIKLKHCEKVKAGQVIGLAGHNGFSSGPHLHVSVFRPVGSGKFFTIPLKFEVK